MTIYTVSINLRLLYRCYDITKTTLCFVYERFSSQTSSSVLNVNGCIGIENNTISISICGIVRLAEAEEKKKEHIKVCPLSPVCSRSLALFGFLKFGAFFLSISRRGNACGQLKCLYVNLSAI